MYGPSVPKPQSDGIATASTRLQPHALSSAYQCSVRAAGYALVQSFLDFSVCCNPCPTPKSLEEMMMMMLLMILDGCGSCLGFGEL